MRIESKKSTKYRKTAIWAIITIALFYSITIIVEVVTGYDKWTETLMNFVYYICFAVFIVLVFPADHFEFTSDELKFRPSADFRRRSVKISDIESIHYEPKRIFLMMKNEKKYEISISNFNEEETSEIKAKFSEMNISYNED